MNAGAVNRSTVPDKAASPEPDIRDLPATGSGRVVYASIDRHQPYHPGQNGLPHLAGPAAAMRQVLAAHALRHCRHIVEIGGAGCPITAYITHRPRSVTVIDPKIEPFAAQRLNGARCEVRHIPSKFQQASQPVRRGSTGLVLLGISLKPLGRQPALSPALLALAASVQTLVIEHAVTLDRALGQIEPLMATRSTPPVIDITLEINDSAIAAAGFGRRRFVVFDRGPASGFD